MQKRTVEIWVFVYSLMLAIMFLVLLFGDGGPTNTEIMGFVLVATTYLSLKIDANK